MSITRITPTLDVVQFTIDLARGGNFISVESIVTEVKRWMSREGTQPITDQNWKDYGFPDGETQFRQACEQAKRRHDAELRRGLEFGMD